jgi:hypothetical protein
MRKEFVSDCICARVAEEPIFKVPRHTASNCTAETRAGSMLSAKLF